MMERRRLTTKEPLKGTNLRNVNGRSCSSVAILLKTLHESQLLLSVAAVVVLFGHILRVTNADVVSVIVIIISAIIV